jgi:hypothetical protein
LSNEIHTEDCSNFRDSLNIDYGYPSPLITTSSRVNLFYARFSRIGSPGRRIGGFTDLLKLKKVNRCLNTDGAKDRAKGQKRDDNHQERNNNTEESGEITIPGLSIRSLKSSGHPLSRTYKFVRLAFGICCLIHYFSGRHQTCSTCRLNEVP